MKLESKIFLLGTPFFILAGVVYTVWSGGEPVGTVGIFLVAALVAMIGGYLALTARRIDPRPEDNPFAEIDEGAGDQGVYAPWSWWPLAISVSAALTFLGLAVGWWLVGIGVTLGIISLIGWVFEYSRGQHAH
ncbi:cytochrome c oxidase subunit 4 [Luteimicrobium subarcticum]|uniref:Cytochrome c oxidase polypeptide 4 n=1 Tax=Luteimicrobium subarcticum TaxID=620910 RepID=A0A2M8WRB1_9MICO|nr:cytochrome c oxidase subunit 4 [Luteimicrobium subarcticum]PJI93482.1 cytochrome c oxidase subunit IV [Luteimicrobium subarcticum]